jgi:hypothetical protein
VPEPKDPAPSPPNPEEGHEDAAGGKRPWQRPEIQSGQLFEANSLACFKSGPTSEECLQSPPFKS